MKFTAIICLLFLSLFSLAACAGEELAEPLPSPIPTVLPTAISTSLPDDATTGASIRARGYLLVGVCYDLQPFGYITDDGEVAGFGIDIGRELARRWLGDDQAVKFRQVRTDTAIEHLQSGDVDIVISALAHTQPREAGADFSLPYFVDGRALLVRAADTDIIQDSASLEGRPVGVADREVEHTLRGTSPFTLAIKTYDRFDGAVAALGRGEVVAVADARRRLFWGKRLLLDAEGAKEGIETAIVGQYTATPLAFAFPQNDPFFADLVTLTFQDMLSDGAYADVYARWFAPEAPPTVERWPGEETLALADAPITTDVPDTIAAIQTRGRLAVAFVSDRAPFAYTDANGAPTGYEIDLARLAAERWLGSGSAVDFTPMALEAGKESVCTGQADLLLGGLAHSRSAEMELDFSLTTYVAGEGLLVRTGAVITDLLSLNGRQVAVVEGSGSRESLLAAAQNAGVSLTVFPRPTLEAAVTSLQEEGVAAVAGERVALLKVAHFAPELDVLPLRLTRVPLALGLPPGDSAFRDLVNLTLQTMKGEGLLDTLYSAWFNDAPPSMLAWPGAPYRTLRLDVAPSPED